MQLEAAHSSLATGDFNIVVSVPPTRSDILHARDVMEVGFITNLLLLYHPLNSLRAKYI